MSKQAPREGSLRPVPPPMLLLAVGTFFTFGALGYALGGQPQAHHTLDSLAGALRPLLGLGGLKLMLLIFINNAAKAGGVILLGVFWGIAPLFFLMSNGLVVGLVTFQAVAQHGAGFAVAALAPHGVVELPALLVAAALGLGVGSEAFQWLRRRPSRLRHRLGQAVRIYWAWLVPALAVAAAIEVFITPVVLGWP